MRYVMSTSESTPEPGSPSKLHPLMNRSVMSQLHSVISSTPTTMATAVSPRPSTCDGADVELVNATDKDEGTKTPTSGCTSPASSMGLIKCPMYCRSNCVIKHHPLLVAILNCVDTAHMELMEMKLGILNNVINKYKQSQAWSVNDPIPDVLDDYKYPMLHWVCTLGRVGAAIWLIGHNISDPMTKSTIHNGESALHRALLCLQETCPVEPSRKFVQLLSVLEPALALPDNNGNTPLHICCEMLRIGLPRTDYYKECLHYMMYELNNEEKNTKQQAAAILNMKNSDGDTPLHLLAESDKHISEIKPLVLIGADYTIENNAGLTPYEVALRCDCLAICRFFETWQGSDPHPTSFVLQGSIQPEAKVNVEVKHDSAESNLSGESTEQTGSSSSPDASSSKANNSPSPLAAPPSNADDDTSQSDPEEVISTGCDEETAEHPPEKKLKLDDDTDQVTSDVTSSSKSTEDLWSMENFSMESRKKLTESSVICRQQLKPVPIIFPADEDLEAQSYFEIIVDEYIKNPKSKVKQVGKQGVWTLNQFFTSMDKLESSDADSRNKFRDAVKHMNPSLITKYLVAMKETQPGSQAAIDFILETRNLDLNDLKMANKCVTSLQQIFREEQTKQDEHVASIMSIFENLTALNKEERKLVKELDDISEHSSAAKITNVNLKERLANCDAALKVLKNLYIDTTTNSKQ